MEKYEQDVQKAARCAGSTRWRMDSQSVCSETVDTVSRSCLLKEGPTLLQGSPYSGPFDFSSFPFRDDDDDDDDDDDNENNPIRSEITACETKNIHPQNKREDQKIPHETVASPSANSENISSGENSRTWPSTNAGIASTPLENVLRSRVSWSCSSAGILTKS
mmetsp:Transcript_4656/g.7065  ORF Transcript_4656/g.7065 Transcript_4656/m.7065 type:complete len:163 (-) Transcript_4656:263-751(-)